MALNSGLYGGFWLRALSSVVQQVLRFYSILAMDASITSSLGQMVRIPVSH